MTLTIPEPLAKAVSASPVLAALPVLDLLHTAVEHTLQRALRAREANLYGLRMAAFAVYAEAADRVELAIREPASGGHPTLHQLLALVAVGDDLAARGGVTCSLHGRLAHLHGFTEIPR